MPIRAKISGTGFCVPDRIVTNDDLSKIINTNDEWIQQRTGIRQRHFVTDQTNVDLAEIAVQKALDMAGCRADEIDALIAATLSPDYSFPSNAPFIQERLGIPNIPSFDVRNQCTGFLYSLATADAFIRSGKYEKVLVIGSEVHSGGLDINDRSRDVAVIFGDGAGAFVVEKTAEDKGILAVSLHGDGNGAKALWTDAERSYENPRLTLEMLESTEVWPKMKGKKVFLEALRSLPAVINEVLDAQGVTIKDIDCFAFHQANLRINQWVASEMNIPDEKIWNNIDRFGNTTAATIPIVITETLEAGLIKEGSLAILAGFGSGFTAAALLVRW